jgi:hypothetical protein
MYPVKNEILLTAALTLALTAFDAAAFPRIRGIEVAPVQAVIQSNGIAEIRVTIQGDDDSGFQCGMSVDFNPSMKPERIRVETVTEEKGRKYQFPIELVKQYDKPGRYVIRATGSLDLAPERFVLGLYLPCAGDAEALVEVLPSVAASTNTPEAERSGSAGTERAGVPAIPAGASPLVREAQTVVLSPPGPACDLNCRVGRGETAAMNDLGLQYAAGEGVEQSDLRAVELFTRAADLGNAVAKHNLAFMYEAGRGVPQNYRIAIDYYRQAAEAGRPDSMRAIARMYVKGHGLNRNLIEAYAWANLATARSQGEERATSERLREQIAGSLGRKEMDRAQERSREIDQALRH